MHASTKKWDNPFFYARQIVPENGASCLVSYFFFFQAEDGIRDSSVTGVQTCALPILNNSVRLVANKRAFVRFHVRSASGSYVTTAILTAKRNDKTVALVPINDGGVIDRKSVV